MTFSPPAFLAAALTCLVLIAPASASDRFTVERAGESGAAPVVFIPGLASSGAVWEDAAKALDDTADIHIVTLAGFAGLAPVEPISPFLDQAVQALAEYLDAEGLEGSTLVGHSLGGQLALKLAAARPERVEAVMVVDSAPFYAQLFNPAATPEQARVFAQSMGAQMAAAPRDQFLAGLAQGLPVQSLDADYRETIRAWGEASDQETVATAFAEIAGGDFRDGLADVRARVLVLAAWAEGAPVSADRIAALYQDQYQALAGAEIRIIEDSRHFIMADQPDAFAQTLRAFLAE